MPDYLKSYLVAMMMGLDSEGVDFLLPDEQGWNSLPQR
jgi:hypothetical protein